MILFNSENNFELSHPETTQTWLSKAISLLGFKEGAINYIFCDDTYLLSLNQKFLNHDTLTDIISFDYSTSELLSGDIFISTERVSENALLFHTTFNHELHRVLIHGILHFAGYKDKTDAEKQEMRKQEDYYLSLHEF